MNQLQIIYTVLEYFLVFSFLGWCTEVVYQAASKGLVINRGFLNGPVCPIYGFGVLAVFLMLQSLSDEPFYEQNALVVFIFGVVLSTAIELFGGWILDKAFHARWWDYSDRPFNLHGYICLQFSLMWGFAILVVVRAVYPMLSHTLSYIPERVGWVLIIIFSIVYCADFAVSVSVMIGLNKRMAELDEMQRKMRVVSNDLSDRIGSRTLETAKRVDEVKVQAALAGAEAREAIEATKADTIAQFGERRSDLADMRKQLEERRKALIDKILSSRHFGAGRLLRAFPDMKHRDHAEVVEMLRKMLQ
ncbi:MAG: hypothetical protein IKE85_08715 [Mogibacterium sp.]|nr:hypothetical protein [Mogibacterium sp.]